MSSIRLEKDWKAGKIVSRLFELFYKYHNALQAKKNQTYPNINELQSNVR